MPGPRWNSSEVDAGGSEPIQTSTQLGDLGPGIRRDERIKRGFEENQPCDPETGRFTLDPIRLFSYGTLQLDSVQLETFGRLLTGAADALPGYSRAMVRITDPAVIAASGADHHPIVAASDDPDDSVEGTVFEITAEELAAADTYEVSDYKRVEVLLASGLLAWVYVRA